MTGPQTILLWSLSSVDLLWWLYPKITSDMIIIVTTIKVYKRMDRVESPSTHQHVVKELLVHYIGTNVEYGNFNSDKDVKSAL